jgi:hypothetical protein
MYSPFTAKLSRRLGEVETRRASHVEPVEELSGAARQNIRMRLHLDPSVDLRGHYPMSWWADMTPSGGDVLGPYANREEALEDEKIWLLERHIPTPAA